MITVLLAGVALAAPVCPTGAPWVRERQQRPPVVEPAPVVTLAVQCGDTRVLPRASGWRLPAGATCDVRCDYADGATRAVSVQGRRITRAGALK